MGKGEKPPSPQKTESKTKQAKQQEQKAKPAAIESEVECTNKANKRALSKAEGQVAEKKAKTGLEKPTEKVKKQTSGGSQSQNSSTEVKAARKKTDAQKEVHRLACKRWHEKWVSKGVLRTSSTESPKAEGKDKTNETGRAQQGKRKREKTQAAKSPLAQDSSLAKGCCCFSGICSTF